MRAAARSFLCAALLAGCTAHEPAVVTTQAKTDDVPTSAADPRASEPALVIDLRHPAEFARGHAHAAINLQWSWSQLEERIAAYVPDRQTALRLVGSQEDCVSARKLLAERGYAQVECATQLELDTTLSTWTVEDLARELASAEPPTVIDVRAQDEWKTGTIEGALLIDHDAAPGLVDKLDPTKRYAIICEGGFRSSQLASLLVRAGFEDVHNVIDGMYAWRER